MPTYEYECQSCEIVFERFQSMSAAPIRKCPECGAKVKRLIGAGAGILFKGSGFYQTDYRSASYKTDANKDKQSKAAKDTGTKSETSSSKKSESKSAATAEK
ncbi:MAG: zinc ribbon domain-containing protein [Kiritimatiellia bacterium]|nr:zinc ribbon domain-containing protein [Kiritimatiellia bacterium]MDP6847591.1 zinc ribbon domain-containing protein [Kiritimatiellia bacterium]